jgi:hypothetical protein
MNRSARRSICTLFDHRYMSRALVMMGSVRRLGPEHEVWALCLTDEAEAGMRKLDLPGTHLVTLAQLQAAIPGLAQARENRILIEFYYTCMAALHRYVFDHDPLVDSTMYVDADIQFFTSPARVFDEFRDADGAITPHNFPPHLRQAEKFGIYNAGWTAFRRTPGGQKCLDWWLERSIEWCYGYVDAENDRFANQRYLNRFPVIAPGMKVLTHKGCNLGPWNISNFRLSEKEGQLYVDEDPLYFFHFHGLKKDLRVFYFDCHRTYRAPYTRLMRARLYRPYVTELVKMDKVVLQVVPVAPGGVVRLRGVMFLGIDIKNALRTFKHFVINVIDLLTGRPILVYRDRVL